MLILLSLSLLASAHDPSETYDAGDLTRADLDAHGGCASMALYDKHHGYMDLPRPSRSPGHAQALDLEHRDPFGVPNVITSEHFAFRWGTDKDISSEAVFEVLDALERAYDVQIGGMGHPHPVDMDGVYFNVYYAGSGPNAPRESRTGTVLAYVSGDGDGYSYMALSELILTDRLDQVAGVAAHELYHVVQRDSAAARDSYEPVRGRWFREASANWAAAISFPDVHQYAELLPAYAFSPHRRVDFYRNGTSEPDNGYQYGAFLWPLHISQQAKDFSVVADVWKQEEGLQNPNEVLRSLLAEREIDMDALWLEHIARNATWDYPDGAVYREIIQEAQARPESADLVAFSLDRAGQDWTAPPERLLPQRYGYNTISLSRPSAGTYTFEIDGDGFGSLGSPAELGATLVLQPYEGTEIAYRRFEFDDDNDSILVADDLDDFFKAYVVIGSWSQSSAKNLADETFAYQIRLDFEGSGTDPTPGTLTGEAPRPPQASACSAAGTVPAGLTWLGGAGLLGLARRRRR